MNRRGIALPLVLWGVAFLSGVVILVAVRINEQMEDETRAEKIFHARMLALKGLAIAMHPDVQESDPLLAGGDPESEGFRVLITDEAGRINPNFLIGSGDRDLLGTLFAAWEADLRVSDAAIDSLADWIDPDDLRGLGGAEFPEYRAAGIQGLPPNADLGDIREMESVLNLRDVLAAKEGWRDYFTVLHEGKININHASDGILEDVAGLIPRQIEGIKAYLAGPDGLPGTVDDQEFEDIDQAVAIAGSSGTNDALEKFFGTGGSVRRIESTGFAGGVKRTVTAVLDGDRLLEWEER